MCVRSWPFCKCVAWSLNCMRSHPLHYSHQRTCACCKGPGDMTPKVCVFQPSLNCLSYLIYDYWLCATEINDIFSKWWLVLGCVGVRVYFSWRCTDCWTTHFVMFGWDGHYRSYTPAEFCWVCDNASKCEITSDLIQDNAIALTVLQEQIWMC